MNFTDMSTKKAQSGAGQDFLFDGFNGFAVGDAFGSQCAQQKIDTMGAAADKFGRGDTFVVIKPLGQQT